ncbi:hypothetical protein SRS16CHR_02699 [Variovorax sp. SRS16]|nr:hypothetical protein SRS16CHR_02699 [Variovorax sp. SRS16]
MCTAWSADAERIYDGGCIVDFKQTGAGGADVIVTPYNRVSHSVSFGPDRCMFDGEPCIRVTATRPDGVQYRRQSGHALEFTIPKE